MVWFAEGRGVVGEGGAWGVGLVGLWIIWRDEGACSASWWRSDWLQDVADLSRLLAFEGGLVGGFRVVVVGCVGLRMESCEF